MKNGKDLNTYANNICYRNMFKGLRIVVSDSAMRELMKFGFDIEDVIWILENGKDAPRKRKEGKIERWLEKGNKILNAVIAKDYNEISKEDCYVLIHVGMFTRKK
jgi:hypothetical protein